MADSQILNVIRTWAAVAWADGILAEAEAEGLRALIVGADLSEDERAAAAKFLKGKVDPPSDLGAISAASVMRWTSTDSWRVCARFGSPGP